MRTQQDDSAQSRRARHFDAQPPQQLPGPYAGPSQYGQFQPDPGVADAYGPPDVGDLTSPAIPGQRVAPQYRPPAPGAYQDGPPLYTQPSPTSGPMDDAELYGPARISPSSSGYPGGPPVGGRGFPMSPPGTPGGSGYAGGPGYGGLPVTPSASGYPAAVPGGYAPAGYPAATPGNFPASPGAFPSGGDAGYGGAGGGGTGSGGTGGGSVTPAGYGAASGDPENNRQRPRTAQGFDNVAVAALITGLCLVLAFVPVVLGVLGLRRTAIHGTRGRGFALTGIVLGVASVIGWIVVAALTFSGVLFADNDSYGDNATLDALYDQCANSDWAACDELFEKAPSGSKYEQFGQTCGNRIDTDQYCRTEMGESDPGNTAA